jgi:hypothetical protein
MSFRWGTIYDNGDKQVHNGLLQFAIEKLLGTDNMSLNTMPKQFAVLSQRLALDINSTTYNWSPDLSPYQMIMEQVANHMRICVGIGFQIETIQGISASEPILSEAASFVMRQESTLAENLSHVLSGFSINSDLGELLVAAFFTSARDAVVVEKPRLYESTTPCFAIISRSKNYSPISSLRNLSKQWWMPNRPFAHQESIS